MIQRLIKLFFVIFLLNSCKSNQEKIAQRWVFVGLETPWSKAVGDAFSQEIASTLTADITDKIKGNRLILDESGHCYGVLLNRYFTGKWEWVESGPYVITHVDYPQFVDIKWHVNKQSNKSVQLSTASEKMLQLVKAMQEEGDSAIVDNKLLNLNGEWTIVAESEDQDFFDKNPDPWSPVMNKWRHKPLTLESPEQIRDRVRNYLQFLHSYFNFAQKDDRYWMSQEWLFSVIKPASNGMALYSEHKIPSRWYQCFYDSAQALMGYKLIQRTFHSDIKVPDENDDLKFNALMLENVIAAFDKLK